MAADTPSGKKTTEDHVAEPTRAGVSEPIVIESTVGWRKRLGWVSAVFRSLGRWLQPEKIEGCRIIQSLGQGSYGEVFGAWSTQHGPVAVKVLRVTQSDADAASRRERFEREVKLLRQQSDVLDCLPAYHSDGTTRSGRRYYVMERLVGETLHDWTQKHPQPDPKELLRIAIELTAAIKSLHELGIRHRDLNSGNIWISVRGGRVRLLDVGLAFVPNQDPNFSQANPAKGNYLIRDPIVSRGETQDPRSDLFSLGCNLFRLWAGRFPWPGPLGTELARSVPPIAVPDERESALALDFRNVIRRLIDPNPDLRPQTANELLKALYEIAAHDLMFQLSRPEKLSRTAACVRAVSEFQRRFNVWKEWSLAALPGSPDTTDRAFTALKVEATQLRESTASHWQGMPDLREPMARLLDQLGRYIETAKKLLQTSHEADTPPGLRAELDALTTRMEVAINREHQLLQTYSDSLL